MTISTFTINIILVITCSSKGSITTNREAQGIIHSSCLLQDMINQKPTWSHYDVVLKPWLEFFSSIILLSPWSSWSQLCQPLRLSNGLNLYDFQGYLQGPTGNLTHHTTPRANFRPRVHGVQWPRVHGVSRELTLDPVRTGGQAAHAHEVSKEISRTPWTQPLDLIDTR